MKGICKITFEGLNFEKLLNTLAKEQIVVLKAKKTSKFGCEIVIYTAFCKKVVALLEQKCYNKIYICNLGWANFVQNCRKHVAFLLAVCMLVPMLAVSSLFCWQIKVDADIPHSHVIAALDELGVRRGSLLTKVNCKSLSSKLANHLNASYALVDRQGSTLFVKLILPQTTNPPQDLSVPSNIVAQADGVITRMVVVQGNAVVKVGDTVKRGQVLVEGKRVYNDGTYDTVTAIAQVWATVSQSATVTHQPNQTVLVDTDQTFTRTVIKLGNYTSQKPVPFEHFRVVECKAVNLCGVVVERQLFCQQTYSQVQVPLSQVLDQLKSDALAQATSKAEFVVLSVNYKVENNFVTATVTGTMDVATNTK